MAITEFQFGTLRCQVNDDGWFTIKQDAEQGNSEQDIGIGKVDGERFKALDNAIRFIKNKFALKVDSASKRKT